MSERLLNQKPGLDLLKAIKENVINPKELHPADRLVLVETLRMEGWGQSKIAQALQCSHSTVKRDVQVLKDRMAPLVAKFTKERVAAEAIGMADGLRQRAIASNKIEIAWQITKELPELMRTLGVLELVPPKQVLELHEKYFIEVIRRSKETHVDGNGIVGPARN